MKLFGKNWNWWTENLGGSFAGLIGAFMLLKYTSLDFCTYRDFVKAFPDIGMCTFGFLLTFLGIIIQGNSKMIEYLMSREMLYRRFLFFNKRIVVLSLFLSAYSYVLGYIKIDNIAHLESHAIAIFLGLLMWLGVDFIKFIKIVYLLLKK